MFLADIYHGQRILKEKVIPAEQVLANEGYQIAMQGLDLHRGIYAHIAGVDLVRDGDGSYYVLEDNLRTPSGVSRSEEHTSELQSLMRISYAVFCLKKKKNINQPENHTHKSQRYKDKRISCHRTEDVH